MFGKTRTRIRGKPFKLFSDELPSSDYDDTNDAGTDPFKDPEDGGAIRGRRRKKRMQSFNDRLSLPSLGTPDRDDNSSLNMSEGRISSGQSTEPNILGSNLEELHNRIRFRYGVQDHVSGIEHRTRLPRRSTTLKLGPRDRPTVIKRNPLSQQGRVNERRKGGVIETHDYRYENAFTEEFSTSENDRGKNEDEAPVKPKSMLQQLLDASAKDFNRRKQINDGLIPHPGDLSYRGPSVRVSSSDIRRKHLTSTPSNETETDNLKPDFKPGILKRETNTDRHNIRIPKVPAIQHRFSPKPRLVHQEPTESFVDNIPRHMTSPGGVVSIHVDVPRGRANDLLLIPQKKMKQKRVNFKDNDEYSEDRSPTDGDEHFRSGRRSKGLTRKHSRHRKASPYPNDEINMTFESPTLNSANEDDYEVRTKSIGKGLTRVHSLKPLQDTDIHLEKPPPQPNDATSRYTNNEKRATDRNNKNNSRFDRNMNHVHEDNPSRDLFSDDVLFVNDSSPAFSTPSPRKELQFSTADHDTTGHSPWRDTWLSLSTFTSTPPEHIKSDSVIPTSDNHKKSTTKVRRAESERIGKHLDIPPLVIPNENEAQIHFNEHFTGSHNPEAIGLDELPVGFDLSELPEDIDRSLSGADLIKAYRLWDRERKAFPAGLRKIDIPFDPRDFILSKLRNANAKSHRSQMQKPEAKVTLV